MCSADLPSMYKNLLLVHTHSATISQPIYRTMCEGPSHTPRFRSTGEVDGVTYASPNIFFMKKRSRTRCCRSCIGTHMNEIKCISFSDSALSSTAASASVSLYFCWDEISVLLFAMVAISSLV